jgi:alpha-L-fucosidase
MHTLYKILAAASALALTFAGAGAAPSAGDVARDRARGIRLPETDNHYRATRDYIEDEPDGDYLHASEAAHEAFRDIKFSVRIHWGIYSIRESLATAARERGAAPEDLGTSGESWPFLLLNNAAKDDYNQLYKTFNPTGFNAEEWTAFFKASGLQCLAFTTKHHEGFSLFHTRTRVKKRVNYTGAAPVLEDCDLAYSIEETPFKRDIVGELCAAARRAGLKMDLYFSHPDWYDADFRPCVKHPAAALGARTPEETERMVARHRGQLREILSNYGKIDLLCLDMWLEPDLWPRLKETIKQVRAEHPGLMLRARGIGNYGDYYTPEGFVPGAKENTNMPWMTIYPLGSVFSYENDASKYKGTKWIVWNLVDACAKGGSFMVGIGPDVSGRFHPAAVGQLLAAGRWLETNGRGIYETRAREVWKEDGDGFSIRFTRTKDAKTVFAFTDKWPGRELILKSVKPRPGGAIKLLGHGQNLPWETTAGGGVKIILPDELDDATARPGEHVWGFEIEV